jgi:hypothetical protein
MMAKRELYMSGETLQTRQMVLGQTDGFRYIGFQPPLSEDEIKKLPIPLMARAFDIPSFTQITTEADGSMTIGFDSMNFYEPFVLSDPTSENSLFIQYAQQAAERIGGISLDQTVRFIGPGSMFSEENMEEY